MNLKDSYNRFLFVAYKVARLHYNYLPKDLQEDILSTAQLNVFEFCNFVLPKLDERRGGDFLTSQCYDFVYKKVNKVYRIEKQNYFKKSLNAEIINKNGESISQLQDMVQSDGYSAQELLENKYKKTGLKMVFASLSNEDQRLFWEMLTNKKMFEFEIAKSFGKSEKELQLSFKKIMAKIFCEVGQVEYDNLMKLLKITRKARQQLLVDHCKAFIEHLKPRRKKIFSRHYFGKETYLEISRDYHCQPVNIQCICRKVLKSFRKFMFANDKEKEDILNSLKYTKFHKADRIDMPMKPVIKQLIALKNCNQIIKKFPQQDQIIIKEYLIKGQTSKNVAKKIDLLDHGVQRRARVLCEKIEVLISGTEAEKTRAEQMLDKNHWQKHKIKDCVKKFMEREDFDVLVKMFPEKDQVVIIKYLIEGQRAPEVAKEIGLGRSGLAYKAVKILSKIDEINKCHANDLNFSLNDKRVEKEIVGSI